MGCMKSQATLHRMVMPGHVCPYGLKAKHLLESRGVTVDDRWLTTREETDAFKAAHGVKTTPQTFIDGARIGGEGAPETVAVAGGVASGFFASAVLMVNNIRDLNLRDVLKVTQENNEFRAHLKYEKREPLIENLDLVVNFDKEFRVRMP